MLHTVISPLLPGLRTRMCALYIMHYVQICWNANVNPFQRNTTFSITHTHLLHNNPWIRGRLHFFSEKSFIGGTILTGQFCHLSFANLPKAAGQYEEAGAAFVIETSGVLKAGGSSNPPLPPHLLLLINSSQLCCTLTDPKSLPNSWEKKEGFNWNFATIEN